MAIEHESPAGADTLVLLQRAAEGDADARDQAWARVFEEVLDLAAAQRRRWSGDWTLETRALASEAFIKLSGGQAVAPNDRKHFLVLVSRAVRQVLLNYAEYKGAAKRGGGAPMETLWDDAAALMDDDASRDFVELHEALVRFRDVDERAARVVELRFFAGLNYEEIADVLEISRATAVRDWVIARAWLNRELGSPTEQNTTWARDP